jgi:PKD repeat protein
MLGDLLPQARGVITIIGVVDAGLPVNHVFTNTAVVIPSSGIGASDWLTVSVQDEPVSRLMAANSSPTPLGSPTTLIATAAAGTNISYTWNFGDGHLGNGAVVSHTYSSVGTYDAIVTATNTVGELTATTSVTIYQKTDHIYLPLVLKNH